MKIEIKSLTEQAQEERDYRDELEIMIDGQVVFYVMDDEPEDSNLSRSFSDCYKIGDLLEKAYNAGKNGEDLVMNWEEVEEI